MKSSRHIFKQSPRLAQSRKLGYTAWRERDEDARRAVPPPPPEPQAGQVVHDWLFKADGWACAVQLLRPADKGRNRPRSDQFTLLIDGQQIAARTSITAALRLVQTDFLPRQQTRAQRRESESWAYIGSARDEADAATQECFPAGG